MALLSKRTQVVLGSLLAAMALTSTFLLCLEPRPTAPPTQVILAANEASRAPEDVLFDTTPEPTPGRWQAIVVHCSGTTGGSARTLDQRHQQLGLVGVGYHFVVGNGKGAPDGQIEMSFRWHRQLPGAHSSGSNADWYNQHALGICLVGDANQPPTAQQFTKLVWLVRELQSRLQIPDDHVIVQFDPPDRMARAGSAGQGTIFPVSSFRRQLAFARTP